MTPFNKFSANSPHCVLVSCRTDLRY